MLRRKRLTILIALLLAPIGLCATTSGFLLAYNRVGRITDFQSVSDGLPLTNTDYVLRLTKKESDATSPQSNHHELAVETANNAQPIQLEQVYFCTPTCDLDFTILQHHNRIYLITVQPSGGSGGHHTYNLYDITDTPPRRLKPIENNPWGSSADTGPYPSCVYPKLVDDTLQFETAYYCDLYPLFHRETIKFYQVALTTP